MNYIRLASFVFLLLTLSCKTAKQATLQPTTQLDLQAHRGGRGLMPENTIPAMKNGIDLEVTTLEMDAIISKDNKVLISHDPFFNDVITTTPEGKFITKKAAPQYLLYSMPYDSIRKYDVGLKPHPDFPQQRKVPAYKPLLSELLDSTEAYAKSKGREIRYNIEIKSKEGSDGIRHPDPKTFSELVLQVLRDKKVLERTTIQSFDVRPLQYIHTKYPSVVLSYLIDASTATVDAQLAKLGFVPSIYSPNSTIVSKALVDKCHEKGMKVLPWTVNTVDEMNRMINMGVDGLISDYPNLYSQLNLKK